MQTLLKPRAAFSLAALLALSPLLSTAARAQTKPNFTSKKHGFALYLPQKPTMTSQPAPEMLGGGTLETFSTPPSPVSYSIVPLVLPSVAAGISQKLYFDSVQQGILKSSKGTAVSARDVKVNGQTARAISWSFTAPTRESKTPVKLSGEIRVYKIGARTYQFTAIVPTAKYAASRAQIAKVFGSIVLAR